MPQSPGEDIVNNLASGFKKVVNAPSDALASIGDKVKSALGGGSSAPKQDTSWHDQMVSEANASHAAAQKPKSSTPKGKTPSYKTGTDYVPKTGPAILHKGEAVLKKSDADKHRAAKFDVGHELGGEEHKPAKEIDHIKTKKAKSGGYVHTHVHTHPEHHPDETHVSADQDAMASHMMEHMGEPNPGEAEADAGQSGIPASAQGATAGAAPAASPVPGM